MSQPNPTRDVEPIEPEDYETPGAAYLLMLDDESRREDGRWPLSPSARQRWLDGVDSGTNREYL